MNNRKTITLKELKSKIKRGDLYYGENVMSDHTGWRMWLGDGSIGLNTPQKGSWGGSFNPTCATVTKVIFIDEVISKSYLAEFMHTFNEGEIEDYITLVTDKSEKEIELENLVDKLKGQLEDAQDELSRIQEVSR